MTRLILATVVAASLATSALADRAGPVATGGPTQGAAPTPSGPAGPRSVRGFTATDDLWK